MAERERESSVCNKNAARPPPSLSAADVTFLSRSLLLSSNCSDRRPFFLSSPSCLPSSFPSQGCSKCRPPLIPSQSGACLPACLLPARLTRRQQRKQQQQHRQKVTCVCASVFINLRAISSAARDNDRARDAVVCRHRDCILIAIGAFRRRASGSERKRERNERCRQAAVGERSRRPRRLLHQQRIGDKNVVAVVPWQESGERVQDQRERESDAARDAGCEDVRIRYGL